MADRKTKWRTFKAVSEAYFENLIQEENSVGFEIQKNTKWNKGLSEKEIIVLENTFGFKFPHDYYEMLQVINGHDLPQIYIDPDGEEPTTYSRSCYQYPNDIEEVAWLVNQAKTYTKELKRCLDKGGFDSSTLQGVIPLYSHRALVVLEDKSKSPVVSIFGNDIIIYGATLLEYWKKELSIF